MNNVTAKNAADKLELAMIDMPKAETVTTHFFGPGIYIREIRIPENVTVVGHHHKTAHLTTVVSGRIAFATEKGPKYIDGPMTFLSGPGRKAVHAITDCVVQNIIATDKTDLDEIEDEFIEKSEAWKQADAAGKIEVMI